MNGCSVDDVVSFINIWAVINKIVSLGYGSINVFHLDILFITLF